MIMLPGTRTAHVSNTELDFGNYSGACNGVNANCFGLFRYGITRYPITAWDVFSTPENTPEVGVPSNWAPNTAYAITFATGAPVRKNGSNYYVLVKGGTSAASGGPTGTGSNIADGTAAWDWYNADFVGAITGGSAYYGTLYQGRNNIIRDTINIATGSITGIRGDGGGKFFEGFIVDQSEAPTSFQMKSRNSYAALNDRSTSPFGILQEGTYTGAAYKHKDTLIGAYGGDATYGALSFNGVLSTGAISGFFGKAGDPNLFGNVPANGAYRLRVGNSEVLAVGGNGLNVAGSYIVNGTPGVSCSGAPTANFQVTNGIVTRC